MTRPKEKPPAPPAGLQFTLSSMTLEYIGALKAQVGKLEEEVRYYRAKSDRLELSIMNSETKAEARVEYAERTDAPGIRNVAVDTKVPAAPTPGFQTSFAKLKEKWDKMTPAEQAAAQGIQPEEPQATVV